MKRFITQVMAVAGALALAASGLAHEGPEHEIEELTERIKKEGVSADLLIERAIEYKVLGKLAEVAKDLERALELDAHSTTAHRELSRAYYGLGKTNEALRAVTRALGIPSEAPDHASLLITRSEILRARGKHQEALLDADAAIREYPDNVEWYLLRSQLQTRLKLTKERVAGLDAGFKQTASGVLEAERVEALIADGQHAAALEKIETELKTTRWRSSWLIRRAKARFAANQPSAAKTDLNDAITELNERIQATSPDASLLADRGLAHDLLEERDQAKRDYQQARDKGFADDWLRERLNTLEERPSEETPGRGRRGRRGN